MEAQTLTINWPCELSTKTRDQLLSIAVKAKSINQMGVPPYASQLNGITYIQNGLAYLTMLNYQFNGSYGIITGSQEWLGAVSIGGFDSSMIKAEEIEPLEVIFFDQAKVERLARHNAEVYQWLFAITKNFTKKWANQLSYQNCNSAIRTLFTLTELASLSSREDNVPCIKATQYQIGDICSVSRSRVNVTIQHYKNQGLLSTSRECIHVLKYADLRDEAIKFGYRPIR